MALQQEMFYISQICLQGEMNKAEMLYYLFQIL